MPDTPNVTEQALTALNQAALAITGNLALTKVLHQIVDSARTLAQARYAALGVPDARGQYLTEFVFSGMSAEAASQIAHPPTGRGLLGALLREGRSIRLPRISDDPRSVGFPPGHPPMESFLGVPIVAGGEILGNLYLADKVGAREFSQSDQELIELLAAHAAIAIQNARLYEQVSQLAIIEERSRIGMDLHDGVIQSIYAVGLTLESARLLLPNNPAEANRFLGQAINSLNDAIRDIRNFILDLRPQRFTGDLKLALARLVREFQANAMVPVTMSARDELLANLPQPIARTVFLTVQEGLANVARHARAGRVLIELTNHDNVVHLSISDNGRGFDPSSQAQTVGHGLANMRARAEKLNGAFGFRSTPGQGTTLELTIPL
ncbi:MAG: GAF domain-containing sensor histidine kinase [Chloroflexota bacterium]